MVAHLGQCPTGFLKGQKRATVVSQLMPLTGGGDESKVSGMCVWVCPLTPERVSPGTEVTLKEFALLFFL